MTDKIELVNLSDPEQEMLAGISKCDNHPPYAIHMTHESYKVAKSLESKGLISTHEIGMGLIIAYLSGQ